MNYKASYKNLLTFAKASKLPRPAAVVGTAVRDVFTDAEHVVAIDACNVNGSRSTSDRDVPRSDDLVELFERAGKLDLSEIKKRAGV